MIFGTVRSAFWDSDKAADTLRRIRKYERKKSHRPTAVVPILDSASRPLVVRHSDSGEWGLIQGHIEPGEHPVATGFREAYEEACVRPEAVAGCHPYLGETRFIHQPKPFNTGFSQGGYYIFVGIRLKPGADISTTPPPGHPPALSDRKWCTSLEEAVDVLRTQPGKGNITQRTRLKVEGVLIPALQSIFHPKAEQFMELLEPIS